MGFPVIYWQMWMLKSNADLFHCHGKCLNSMPVAEDGDEDDLKPIQQEPPTTEGENAKDEQPYPPGSPPRGLLVCSLNKFLKESLRYLLMHSTPRFGTLFDWTNIIMTLKIF